MIIREFGMRQARRALAAPLRQSVKATNASQCIRSLSTDQTTTEPASQNALESSTASSQPPSIFTRNIRPSVTRSKPQEPSIDVAEEFHKGQRLSQRIGKKGSFVQKQYRPSDLIRNPAGPEDISLELLMAAQTHMGHNTSLWNPANARYIHGIREGIHIISLEQTASHLRRAVRVIQDTAFHGGIILFVGTRPGQAQITVECARLAKGYHLFNKWTPGTITNSETLLNSLPVNMIDENDEEVPGWHYHSLDRPPVKPDLVVCLNPLENFVMLHECALVNVPTIGIIDTNTEPTWVTYPIPANDDSIRSVSTIGSILARAAEMGHEKRLELAQQGTITWSTPPNLTFNMTRQIEAEKKEEEISRRFAADQARMAALAEESQAQTEAKSSTSETESLDQLEEDDFVPQKRGSGKNPRS